jgi:RNA polymerase sigma-70 factor (ECF subfamily)
MDTAARRFRRRDGVQPQAVESRAFDELYAQYFDFVWRNLRRLGVADAAIEDAAQDTFVVVHRRRADLRADASPKAWLFAIARRVAHDYRRSQRRKGAVSFDADSQPSARPGPFEDTARSQAVRALERFLSSLDDARREVFVMAELEHMTAPEMSESLGVGVNTVYSRLHSARERFVAFLEREGHRHG